MKKKVLVAVTSLVILSLMILFLICSNTDITNFKIQKEEFLNLDSSNTIIGQWNISATDEDNVTATLYTDGTLVIEGNGDIKNFIMPWYDSENSITNVEIGDGVADLGDYTFYGCNNLTNINIPSGVKRIGAVTFNNCSSLTSIEIPETVTSIEDSAFRGCSSLINIKVDTKNLNYEDEDGVLFNKNKTQILVFPSGKGIDDYTVPESVTSIGDYAFDGCSNLTNINIQDGVTSIGYSTFRGCSSLINIKVDIKNLNYEDEDGVLFNKNKTQIMCFPEGKKIISYTIPASVTRISSYAFYGCIGLESIDIPESVISIGNYAFKGCSSLRKIDIPERVTSIGYATFNECIGLESINIPKSATQIDNFAFEGCSSLTRIEIPEGITSIGYDAFGGCNKLEKITVYCNSYAHEHVKTNYKTKLKVIGHTEVIENAVPATCTEKGKTEGKHCSVCNEILVVQEEITSLGHTEVIDEALAATCTTAGETEGKHCSVCNEVLVVQEVVEALGHIEVIDNAVPATCTEKGKTEGKHCSVCNEVLVEQEEIAALGHIEVIDNAVTPTCTQTGLTEGKHCSVCNEVLVAQEEIAALGHNFGEWIIDKQATQEEEGHKYRVCENCNTEKEEQVIPKLSEELQVSTTYELKEIDNMKFIISNINTNVNQLLSNITSNKELKVIDKSGNELKTDELVGTGAKVVTKEENKVVYTVVLQADVNCDGKVTFKDIITANAIRINNNENISKAVFLATDIDNSKNINFLDIIKINSIRINSL